MKNVFIFSFVLLIPSLIACEDSKDPSIKGKGEHTYSNEVLLDWNELLFKVSVPVNHPNLIARISAMMHIAMHDALNAIDPQYESYAYQGNYKKADEKAAVASAAYTVLVNSLPDLKPDFDEMLNKSLSNIKEGDKKTQGIALGKEAAMKILSIRQNDGAFQVEPIVGVPSSSEPGVYQVVPPFDFVYAPDWKTMEPFALENPKQFRSGSYPSLDSEAYAKDFNEVKEIGRINSTVRNEDQSASAKFWYEFSEIGWNRIARVVVKGQKTNLYEAARLFALLNIAMEDAYTSGWDAKFYWNFWRPYTAIRAAAADGNSNTAVEASWESAEPTPPVPDYPSTHSALGNAAATILTSVLGDKASFTVASATALPEGTTRTFTSFMEAADENADSRVMAGIHFRFACEAGQELGNKVGQWTIGNYLRPL